MPASAPTRARSTIRAAPARPKRRTAKEMRGQSPGALGSYLQQSQTPLSSLLFVLPLLVLHEIGVQYYATLPGGGGIQYRIEAFTLLTRFLQSCGATGRYLPALAVVAILLSWHVARGDRWLFDPRIMAGMLVESLFLA